MFFFSISAFGLFLVEEKKEKKRGPGRSGAHGAVAATARLDRLRRDRGAAPVSLQAHGSVGSPRGARTAQPGVVHGVAQRGTVAAVGGQGGSSAAGERGFGASKKRKKEARVGRGTAASLG